MLIQSVDRPTVLLWDEDDHPPPGNWITVLWSRFCEDNDPNIISIPVLVEEQAVILRSRYLDLIYKLGETKINAKRLVDHLELRPGFSYWWMTLIVEKSYFKSPQLYDVIRLLAFEELIVKLQSARLILACSDHCIGTILRSLCRKKGIEFEWRRNHRSVKNYSLTVRFYRLLPYPIQTVSYLISYIRERWALKQNINEIVESFGHEITFVDYLIHLDNNALITNRFASNYWTELIAAFDQTRTKVNWLHHYVQHEIVPDSKFAHSLTKRFNKNSSGAESHLMLDGALGMFSVLAAIRDYLRLVKRSLWLGSISSFFQQSGTNLDLWPLFKRDWLHSVRGPTAMRNCLVMNMFERILNQMPQQRTGVYLQENQGWEMAFIHAWRSAGHGNLVGVAHSTVRFWDLRYFADPRSYVRTGKNDMPMPDQVALNGPIAMKTYCDGHYPIDQIVEVEALRYLYLRDIKDSKTSAVGYSEVLKVLVCGDIMPDVTKQMMQWLVVSNTSLTAQNIHYIVKPHPACKIIPDDYPSLRIQLTNAPLAELLHECDVVFTSNNTSASVDAYCSCVPVVQLLDGKTFHMSPLSGLKGSVYVTNPSELSTALSEAPYLDSVVSEPYFCLDRKLPRWRKLLNLNSTGIKTAAEK